MRLGSFWGLPAPMILLLQDEKNDFRVDDAWIRRGATTLSKARPLIDLHTEFAVLNNVLDSIHFRIAPTHEFFFEANPSAIYKDGNIFIDGGVSEESTTQFILDYAASVACTILTGPSVGKYYKLPFDGTETAIDARLKLIKLVQERLAQEKKVTMKALNRITLDLLKPFKAETAADYSILLQAFGLQRELPNAVSVDGNLVQISDNAKAVLSYFVNNREKIYQLQKNLMVADTAELKIFDTPFTDLIRRKPVSLFYIVSDCFDYVKGKQNAVLIQNVTAMVRENTALYKESIDTKVHPDTQLEDAKALTTERFTDLITSYSKKKYNFFQLLRAEEILNLSQTTEDVLEFISVFYDGVSNLDAKGIASIFDLPHDVDWSSLIEELCTLGICGINLRSTDLLVQALENTVLYYDERFSKPQEEIDDLNLKIRDVNCLLDSLIPIGEAI